MIVPIVEEHGVRTIAHVLHQLVDDVGLRGPGDAGILLDLRVDHAERAGHAHHADIGLLLDTDDLRSRLGCCACGCDAGKAKADHQNIALLLFGDVCGFGGLFQKRRRVSARIGRACGRSAGAFCGGAVCLRLGSATGESRTCGYGRRCSQTQERATRQPLHPSHPFRMFVAHRASLHISFPVLGTSSSACVEANHMREQLANATSACG